MYMIPVQTSYIMYQFECETLLHNSTKLVYSDLITSLVNTRIQIPLKPSIKETYPIISQEDSNPLTSLNKLRLLLTGRETKDVNVGLTLFIEEGCP